MKATEQYFPVVLVYYAVQGGSNFWVCGWNPKVWVFKWKLLSSTFLFITLLLRFITFIPVYYAVVLTFVSVGEILRWSLKSVTIQMKAIEQYFPVWCCLLYCTIWLWIWLCGICFEILSPFVSSRHKLDKSNRTALFKTNCSFVDLVSYLYNNIFLVVCSLALQDVFSQPFICSLKLEQDCCFCVHTPPSIEIIILRNLMLSQF